MQRPSKENHRRLNRRSARESAHRLVDHGAIDTGSNIFTGYTLIDQRLNIRLGKHAASGSNGVDLRRRKAHAVKLVVADTQKRGHLIDKRPRSARASAVHACIGAVGKKDDLGILTTQLNDRPCLGKLAANQYRRGVHLLYKQDPQLLGNPHARRARDRHTDASVTHRSADGTQHLMDLATRVGIVTLVRRIEDVSALAQHQLRGRGAHINSEIIMFHRFSPFYNQIKVSIAYFKAIFKPRRLKFINTSKTCYILPKKPKASKETSTVTQVGTPCVFHKKQSFLFTSRLTSQFRCSIIVNVD